MGDLTSYYEGESHEALYQQLQAGDPASVSAASDHWGTVASGLNDISTALTRDLASLNERWSSASGDEFTVRVQTVVDFAADNSRQAAHVKTSLASFAAELKAAQAKVDDPADTDDNDSTWAGMAAGGLVAGPAGLVAGGILGNNRDDAQREKAKARTVELIAGLASEYQLGWAAGGVTPPAAPPKLPGSVDNSGPGDTRGPGASNVGDLGGTGTGSGTGSRTKDAPDSPSQLAEIGGPGGGGGGTSTADPSTSLEGVSGGSGGSGGTGGTIGGITPGVSGGGGSLGGAGLALGGLAAGVGGLAAGALGLGGGQSGARPGTGGAGSPNASSAARPGTGGAGAGKGAGTGSAGQGGGLGKDKLGVPRQGAGGAGLDGQHGAQNNRNAAGARNAAGGRGFNGEDEDTDDHTTWLTEDDMVWGQDGSAPPPVLGGR